MLITLREARSRVRELADIESYDDEVEVDAAATNDPRFLHTRKLDRAINRWLRRLWNKYQLAFGEDWTTRDLSIALVSGQTDYAIDEDWLKILAVNVYDGSNWYYDLGRYEPRDEAGLRSFTGTAHPSEWYYRIVDTRAGSDRRFQKRLRLLPGPAGDTYTLELRYVPTCPELDHPDATFEGVNGWEDWALYGAAAEMAALDTAGSPLEGSLTQTRLELGRDIDQLAAQRDAADAIELQDVRGDHWAQHDLSGRTTIGGGGMV